MNHISIQEPAKIITIGRLIEGNSSQATSKLNGAGEKTILWLLAQ